MDRPMGQIGYQGLTHEWRYPVIDRREPVGVRTVKGYVHLLRHEHGGAPTFTTMFTDLNGAPVNTFDGDTLWVFVGAARAAIEHVVGHDTEEFWAELWKVGGITHPIKAPEDFRPGVDFPADSPHSEPARSDP